MKESDLTAFEQNESIIEKWPIEILKQREEFKKEIGLNHDDSIVACGHQVMFYHPGIIAKSILASNLALSTSSIAFDIILDHDPNEIYFDFPCIDSHAKRIQRQSIPVGSSFYKDQRKPNDEFFSQIEKIPSCVENELGSVNKVARSIKTLLKNKDLDTVELITQSRLEDLYNEGFSLRPLYVSKLITTKAWRDFSSHIIKNYEPFKNSYNQALNNYRDLNKIKNHAQPMPNLENDDLPFWTSNHETAYRNEEHNEFLPKAITLTLFLRVFFSDIFIHGLGGARYDQITDTIIEDFYQIEVPNFLTATATLKLPVSSEYTKSIANLESLRQNTKRLRDFRFNPQRLLNEGHELYLENIDLQNKAKVEDIDRSKLHHRFVKNRAEIQTVLADLLLELNSKRDKIIKNDNAKRLLHDRTLPYFFYDLSTLF